MRDALGHSFEFRQPPKRVVSLVPSLTETLFDLGAGADVAGITKFCIFPPDLALPRIGGTKNPNLEAIRRLHPDLVHMNLEENLEKHAIEIEKFAPVFVTEPKSIDDVGTLLETLGEIHDRRDAAAQYARLINEERGRTTGKRLTFVCAIWKEPWMWCGGDTYVSNLVESAGGVNLLATQARYPSIELETVLASSPDVVFLPDEPYAFTEGDAEAVRSNSRSRVVGPFPGHLFTWHGTRTLLGLRFLRDVMG